MQKLKSNYWAHTPLSEMTQQEWEALCDGCAKCCLHRLEDDETQEIHYTNVCCRYLDQSTCSCTDYANRSINVPDCVTVTLEILQDPYWLPETCAYRLLAQGDPLPAWHPLVSGTPETVITSANSVGGRAVNELEADNLEQHIIEWVH